MTPIEQLKAQLLKLRPLVNSACADDADEEALGEAQRILSSMEGQTKTDPVDPLKDPLWSEIRSDIEKAAVDWATYPDSSVMDSDLHGQFIRVMAYVIESTNILHKSPRASPSVPCISVEDAIHVVMKWIYKSGEIDYNTITSLLPGEKEHGETKYVADLRERLTKAAK